MKTTRSPRILWAVSLQLAVLFLTFFADVLCATGEPVNFPDKALKAAVERTLGVINPTPADMLQLTELSSPRLGIADLTGLEYATNLRVLDLHLNNLRSVPALATLVKLEELDLGGNLLTHPGPLSNLVVLRKLDLHGGRWLGQGIVDIAPLAPLSNLESLDLGSNRLGVIGDLSPLAGMTKLRKLELWSNRITDVKALAALTNLSELELWNNQISDIAVLSGLANLKRLDLAGNRITDLCPLDALYSLEFLDAVSNPLNVGAWDLCVPQIRAHNPSMELCSDLDPQDNLLVNGGFEQGLDDPNWLTSGFKPLSWGNMEIPGWRVTRGSIDYQLGYWEAADGTRSIDLYGSPAVGGEGGIGQTFSTIPGHFYKVALYLSGNPEGPAGEDPVKWLWVQAAGQTRLFSFDCTNSTKSNMQWRQVAWVFTARQTTTTIDLFSRYHRSGSSHYGPAIDRVSVQDVLESSLPLPATIYVDDDAPADGGPGDPQVSDPNEDGSAAHPYDAIQEAIDAANAGDTIIVLDGTFTGTGNRGIHFSGASVTLASQNGPSNCIIDCQGQGRAFVLLAYEEPTTVLQGLTISNGDVSSETGGRIWGSGNGGAVCCTMGASPTIRNCVFNNNRANYGGGAIACDGAAAPALVECTFINNSAVGTVPEGGAVRSGASLVLRNCRFIGNSARLGGAVNCGGDLAATNCLFTGNSAAQAGGALYVRFSSGQRSGGPAPLAPQIELRGCTLAANSAASGRAFACLDTRTKVLLDNCILWDGGSEIDSRAILTVTCSDVQGGFKGEGNIALDPAFVNPSLGDYHLSLNSPCINLGNPNYVPADGELDIDGQPRVTGGRVDMGADEYAP